MTKVAFLSETFQWPEGRFARAWALALMLYVALSSCTYVPFDRAEVSISSTTRAESLQLSRLTSDSGYVRSRVQPLSSGADALLTGRIDVSDRIEHSEQEVAHAVDGALRAILGDLRKLEPEFAQLSGITRVELDAEGFTFEKGLRSPIKVLVPKFDRAGCFIAVDRVLYRPGRDRAKTELLANSARAFEHFELNGGLRYAIWTIVRAEQDAEGKRFQERVRKVISKHLGALHERWSARPVEPPR